MTNISKASLALSLPALALASCATPDSGDTRAANITTDGDDYTVTAIGTFDRPWVIEFIPGTNTLAITEKAGTLKLMKTSSGQVTVVSGVPDVAFGGQGGLGDIAFLPSEEGQAPRTIYLSYAEASGDGKTFGAAVGQGTLTCEEEADSCQIDDFKVIWRQSPKTTGKGHYSHRLLISPDEKCLYVASGDRQKQTPAQDTSNTLGTIVRLNLDGTPAAGNPMAGRGGVTREIWSYGHRNILGMDWDAQGRLWEIEHGPAGGDELNLVKRGANYGWPTRSNGNNYNGSDIPDHTADDGFAKPAIGWTPVIAPGDMIIYSGKMFRGWEGDALIAGLKSQALVRVSLNGEDATETARYQIGGRLRSVEEGPDGAIWVAEDGNGGRVLKISAK